MPPTPPQSTPPTSRKPKPDLNHTKETETSQPLKNYSELPKEIETTQAPTRPTQDPVEYDSSDTDYNLRPPNASKTSLESIETLSELLYSPEYLKSLMSSSEYLPPFISFLQKFQPTVSHFALHYLETQKVIKAVEYANAVAASLSHPELIPNERAADISPSFRKSSQDAFNTLLNIALPAWVTYSLVNTSNACLAAEITGESTPLTGKLVGGLSEVFCLTDPNQDDNPIIYATQEFYRLTRYGKDSVIGYNCRFLQGPKTNRSSIERLREAITKGHEICETLLNYRRDGRAFINILMLAPLVDDKGNVKYYLGAQVDASRLVENGRGVNGFGRFLAKRAMDQNRVYKEPDPKQFALAKLKDLGKSFDLEESAAVQNNSPSCSTDFDEQTEGGIARPGQQQPLQRRRLQDEDGSDSDREDDQEVKEDTSNSAWKLSHEIPSGRLPGIYKKYVLIRPYPSLRVVFASPFAQTLGKLEQNPFLSHIAAPMTTLSGLKDSFQSGIAVTAKVAIRSHASEARNGTVTAKWGRKGGPVEHGETCWISATPLLDSNAQVGVWMVVIVDRKVAFASNTRRLVDDLGREEGEFEEKPASLDPDEMPIKPILVGELDQDESMKATELTEDPSKSQRSERDDTIKTSKAMTDAFMTESPNGLPALPQALDLQSPDSISQQPNNEMGQDWGPKTPPNRNLSAKSDKTPTQRHGTIKTSLESSSGRGARVVGLRAMDYLTVRSMSMRQLQWPSGDAVKDAEKGRDKNCNLASSYSVD
jgi:PAS domain S-box-containing protein